MNIWIGINGYAGVGKDSFADALVENYDFTKIAFADPIRKMLYDTNPIVMVEDGSPVYMRELVDTLGWEESKRLYPEIRQMMGNYGETAKSVLHFNVWVNHALERAEGMARVVFSDVRFLNEAAILTRHYGATLVKMARPGVGPANTHEAHRLSPDLFHHYIMNDSDLIDLKAKADILMNRIYVEREGSSPPTAKVIK